MSARRPHARADRGPRRHAGAPSPVFAGCWSLYPVVHPYATYQQGVLLLAFLLALHGGELEHHLRLRRLRLARPQRVPRPRLLHRRRSSPQHTGVNPLWFAPLGGLVAVVMATLVGLVVLRTRGHAFVIITIALLLAAQVAGRRTCAALTNGSNGITLELPFWSHGLSRTSPSTTCSWSCSLLTVAVQRAGSGGRSSAPACSPSARTRARRPRSASTPPGTRCSRTRPARSSSASPAASTPTS